MVRLRSYLYLPVNVQAQDNYPIAHALDGGLTKGKAVARPPRRDRSSTHVRETGDEQLPFYFEMQ